MLTALSLVACSHRRGPSAGRSGQTRLLVSEADVQEVPRSLGLSTRICRGSCGDVAIWKPKLDALAAKLPAGKFAAGLAGIQNLFNAGTPAGAGVAAVAGLGKDPAVLCPGGGANRFQELQLCFKGFPKGVQAGKMAGTNTPALLVSCAGGDSNCAAANVPID